MKDTKIEGVITLVLSLQLQFEMKPERVPFQAGDNI
jgi:hypothetical protein